MRKSGIKTEEKINGAAKIMKAEMRLEVTTTTEMR